MTYTTQAQIRVAFWRDYADIAGVTKHRTTDYSGKGKMHNTDTRCAFVEFVDMLARNGDISQALAQRVTL